MAYIKGKPKESMRVSLDGGKTWVDMPLCEVNLFIANEVNSSGLTPDNPLYAELEEILEGNEQQR